MLKKRSDLPVCFPAQNGVEGAENLHQVPGRTIWITAASSIVNPALDAGLELYKKRLERLDGDYLYGIQ